MILSIQLDAVSATSLRGRSAGDSAVGKLLERYHLQAEPLFPSAAGLADSQGGIFQMRCPDGKAADVLKALLNTPGVEGAWANPGEAPPEPP